MQTNESVLHDGPSEYSMLISASFDSATNEVDIAKTAVAIRTLKRIQYCVSPGITVDLKLNGQLICQLSGNGLFVFDSSWNAGEFKIDRGVYDGILYVTTHNATDGAGYTLIVTGSK